MLSIVLDINCYYSIIMLLIYIYIFIIFAIINKVFD